MDHGLDGAKAAGKKAQLMHIPPDGNITGSQVNLMPLGFQNLFRVFQLRHSPAGQDKLHIFRYISCGFQAHAASAAGYYTYICHFLLLYDLRRGRLSPPAGAKRLCAFPLRLQLPYSSGLCLRLLSE
jgi:hypothetical protein